MYKTFYPIILFVYNYRDDSIDLYSNKQPMTEENTTSSPTKKLLDQVREKIRSKHYRISTKKTYISWSKHYIVCHGKRHPADMGAVDVERFLTYL